MRARILVVEDEAVNLALLRAVLHRDPELRDADVVEAGSIAAARAAIADGPFDVAVLDQRLPDGDGLALVDELRAQPSSPRILVVSANVTEQRRREVAAIGVDGFVAKPYRPPALVAELHRLLATRTG